MPSRALLQATGEEPSDPRATPATAFAAATAHFLAGDRLDMAALAGELGVGRTTLYRWTGDRDQLLADVIWVQLSALLDHVAAETGRTGRERLERGVGQIIDVLTGSPAMQAFLANEGAGGLLLATDPDGLVRPRLVARVAELVEQVVREDGYVAPAPPAVLADAIVTIAERYLHNAGDPRLNPPPSTAREIVRLILRED